MFRWFIAAVFLLSLRTEGALSHIYKRVGELKMKADVYPQKT